MWTNLDKSLHERGLPCAHVSEEHLCMSQHQRVWDVKHTAIPRRAHAPATLVCCARFACLPTPPPKARVLRVRVHPPSRITPLPLDARKHLPAFCSPRFPPWRSAGRRHTPPSNATRGACRRSRDARRRCPPKRLSALWCFLVALEFADRDLCYRPVSNNQTS